MTTKRRQVTQLLQDAADGREAVEKVLPLVYRELHAIAAQHLGKERHGHTLQTQDLVHEAYLRLFDKERMDWNDRRHFFSTAAMAMRRIMVDHARKKAAGKRIPQDQIVTFDDELVREGEDERLLDLDEALAALAQIDERQAHIVELRFFGGFGGSEVAELLDISPSTVAREWVTAKLWLRREMDRAKPPASNAIPPS